MNRTVTVPARGKREEFKFEYEAPSTYNEALTQAGGTDKMFEAYLLFRDHQETLQHTTAEKEAEMLFKNFTSALKYLAKAIGLEKALETLVGSGGYNELTDEQLNEAKTTVENPKPRKPRTKKVVETSVPATA